MNDYPPYNDALNTLDEDNGDYETGGDYEEDDEEAAAAVERRRNLIADPWVDEPPQTSTRADVRFYYTFVATLLLYT
jgi:hypothetical protein